MEPAKVMIGLVPFFAFSLLITVVDVGWAAAVALATAVVVIMATGLDGIKAVPLAQAVILLAIEFAGFSGHPPLDAFLTRYGPAVAALLLGLFIIVTAAATPFTAQFARRDTPPELCDTRRFREVNRRASTAWGLAVLVLGLCHLLSALLGDQNLDPSLLLIIAWGLPLVAFWQVTGYTRRALATAPHDQAHRAGEVTA